MENTIKKSRKAVQNYNFETETNGTVSIDLNNYTAVCTVTGNPKKFYHSYLADMIKTKFDNNIDVFEQNYVSREGKAGNVNQRKVEDVRNRIGRLYNQIRELKAKRDQLIAAS